MELGPAAGVLLSGAPSARRKACDAGSSPSTWAAPRAVDGGEPAITPTLRSTGPAAAKVSGPSYQRAEVESGGAGGGSIAHTDKGLIKVGPESAGADPGPVCYGRGGEKPTVTDANVVLGYINPDYFNGGAMRLDAQAAADAVQRHIGAPLGLDAGEAAWGIHTLANANMERAMRIVSIERGRDPRKYALVAFGGAGPLHAARLALALGIPKIVVPFGAGVGSAIGMLEADSKLDASMTHVLKLTAGAESRIADIYGQLQARLDGDLKRMGSAVAPSFVRFAYLRYAGQGHEVTMTCTAEQTTALDALRKTFDAEHKALFGHMAPEEPVEVVSYRVRGVGIVPAVAMPKSSRKAVRWPTH